MEKSYFLNQILDTRHKFGLISECCISEQPLFIVRIIQTQNVYAKCTVFSVKPNGTLSFRGLTFHLDRFIMSQTIQLALLLEGKMNRETTALNSTQQRRCMCRQHCRVAVLNFMVLIRKTENRQMTTAVENVNY
jgi:hypothetical protein